MKPSPFEPEFVEVIMVDGLPSRIKYRRKMQKVREILNLWRIDDGWWQRPVSRFYYFLELEGGSRVTVFHDLIHDGWYRQNWSAS